MLSWIKTLFSLMPDLSGFKEMGFSVRTRNSDLFVELVENGFTIRFFQGLEPHNPEFMQFFDFDIPDGVVIITFSKTPIEATIEACELSHVFESCYQREHFWIFFNKRLDFATPNMHIKMGKLIKGARIAADS